MENKFMGFKFNLSLEIQNLIIDMLVKKQILEELKNKVSEMEEKPSLVVNQIGDNDASNVYIKQKANMADYIGYGYRHIKLGRSS